MIFCIPIDATFRTAANGDRAGKRNREQHWTTSTIAEHQRQGDYVHFSLPFVLTAADTTMLFEREAAKLYHFCVAESACLQKVSVRHSCAGPATFEP